MKSALEIISKLPDEALQSAIFQVRVIRFVEDVKKLHPDLAYAFLRDIEGLQGLVEADRKCIKYIRPGKPAPDNVHKFPGHDGPEAA